MDVLERLPPEVALRVFDFCSLSSLAQLTRVNRVWHKFIDEIHQDTIYISKASIPPSCRDLSFLDQSASFVNYFEGTQSFKELCKRQTLLSRNWNDEAPTTRESVLQIGNDPVWRFRPDFKRRFFVSTSQHGGFNVSDIETGGILWRVPKEEVRPFAHLEYQDGVAVWDVSEPANSLQVWKTDVEGLARGVLRKTATLRHDCEIRGFQFAFDTLCVASSEGKGFVYDMSQDPPELKTRLKIEEGAHGHLYQNEDVVMFAMGKKGYHIYDKSSGALVGAIHPKNAKKKYHIHHPDQGPTSIVSTGSALDSLPSIDAYPPKKPSRDRSHPLEIVEGPFAHLPNAGSVGLENDEWGAGLLSGSLMVGISRAGRLFICRDWENSVRDARCFEENASIIECEADESSFDIGGWLSVRDHRILVEVQDHVYVVALNHDGSVKSDDRAPDRPSYCFATSSASQLAVPVSFMEIFDECIMATYATLGWQRPDRNLGQHMDQGGGIFPTKTIRVLSFAPELGDSDQIERSTRPDGSSRINEEAHEAILDIMEMLSDEESEEGSEDDRAWP